MRVMGGETLELSEDRKTQALIGLDFSALSRWSPDMEKRTVSRDVRGEQQKPWRVCSMHSMSARCGFRLREPLTGGRPLLD